MAKIGQLIATISTSADPAWDIFSYGPQIRPVEQSISVYSNSNSNSSSVLGLCSCALWQPLHVRFLRGRFLVAFVAVCDLFPYAKLLSIGAIALLNIAKGGAS